MAYEEKPREETEYDTYYPDLLSGTPLNVYVTCNGSASNLDSNQQTDCESLAKHILNYKDESKVADESVIFPGTSFRELETASHAPESLNVSLLEKLEKFQVLRSKTHDTDVCPQQEQNTDQIHVQIPVLDVPWVPSESVSVQGHSVLKRRYFRESDAPFKDFFQHNTLRAAYDMDEQDRIFLAQLNAKRAASAGASAISEDLFETFVTFLEKKWYLLQKRIPRARDLEAMDTAAQYGSDDGTGEYLENDQPCAICDISDCDSSNAIVFCDGCNIAVHQECYGIVFIPEGQWLCRVCYTAAKTQVRCLLCPSQTGAFKQTDNGYWVHLLCALWIPETSLKSSVYMETVEGIERIPMSRWKLRCYICKQKSCGACIQCSNRSCFQAFHVTCAKRSNLYMAYSKGIKNAILNPKTMTSYCDKHTPHNWVSPTILQANVLKTRQFFQQKRPFRTRDIVLPLVVYSDLVKLAKFYNIGDCESMCDSLCRYWTLKRKLNGNAPLLKVLDNPSFESVYDSTEALAKIEWNNVLLSDIHKLLNVSEALIQRERAALRQHLTKMEVNELQLQLVTQGKIRVFLMEVLRNYDKDKVDIQNVVENFLSLEYFGVGRVAQFKKDFEKQLEKADTADAKQLRACLDKL